MNNWIRISFPPSEELASAGRIETRTRTSQYDIPTAFRVLSPEVGVVRVEFRYLDRDEPRLALSQGRELTIYIGAHSRRLLGFDFSVPNTEDPAAVIRALQSEQLRSALRRLRIETTDEISRENYSTAEQVLRDRKEIIAQEAVTA